MRTAVAGPIWARAHCTVVVLWARAYYCRAGAGAGAGVVRRHALTAVLVLVPALCDGQVRLVALDRHAPFQEQAGVGRLAGRHGLGSTQRFVQDHG